MKRALIAAMAALTMTTSVVAPSMKVFAAEYNEDMETEYEDEYSEDMEIDSSDDRDIPSWAKESGKALIKKSIGVIPGVGSLSDVIAPLISSILGLDSESKDQTAEKINEIANQLKNIELKLDNTLATLYENGKLQQFNIDMTDIRNMTADFYCDIATIQSNPNTSDAEKALEIGALLQTRSSSVADFTSIVNRATSFLIGDQVVTGNPEIICVTSYNATCKDSVLGCEAAMKNAAYINNVTTILANAYKLEALVLDSKIILAENMNGSKMSEEEKKALEEKYSKIDAERNLLGECKIPDKVNIWKTAAGVQQKDGTYSGIKGKYDATVNSENPNSVISKYNKMVKDNWYSFIKSAKFDGKTAAIVFQPIRIAVGKDYSFKNMGGRFLMIIDVMTIHAAKI